VELQNAKQRFEEHGLKLAAISYDSRAILKDFAARHNIDFPLLADPHSSTSTRTASFVRSTLKRNTRTDSRPIMSLASFSRS